MVVLATLGLQNDRLGYGKDRQDFLEAETAFSLSSRGNFTRMQGSGQLPKNILNFMLEPNRTVAAFRSCEADPNCRIMYLHARKTGGTTVESGFRRIFGQEKQKSCCDDRLMHWVHKDPEYYCGLKFSSYQVSQEEFFKVVHMCAARAKEEMWKAGLPEKPPRFLLLSTFREPIQQTISWIHQTCNNMRVFGGRPEDVQAACLRCDYHSDEPVWDGLVQQVTGFVNDTWHVAHLDMGSYEESVVDGFDFSLSDPEEVQLESAIIEVPDLGRFFQMYKPNHPIASKNPEEKGNCDFYTPSEMIKKLRAAEGLYRQMVAGF